MQKLSYCLLNEKWINAIDIDGNPTKVGIMDVFKNGHNLKDLRGNNDTEFSEYELYRFLIVMFMDMYRAKLNSDEDKIVLYRIGKFDESMVDEYFDKCKEEGVTFDLLDEERPFMQCAKKDTLEIDKKFFNETTPVSSLSCKIPTGNNLEFYTCNGLANEVPIHLSDYAYYLIHSHASAKCGCGYIATPLVPKFSVTTVLIKGDTVFDNIVLNSAVVPENASVPFWRWTKPFDMEIIDILNGMLFPSGFYYPDYTSVNSENKTISRMYRIKNSTYESLNKIADLHKKIWFDQFEPHGVTKKVSNKDGSLKVPMEFYNNIGLLEMCDLLGITDKDTKLLPNLSNVINSTNMAFYMRNVDKLYNAYIDIYTISYKNQAMIKFATKSKNEIPLDVIINSPQNINAISDFVTKIRNVQQIILHVDKNIAKSKKKVVACREMTNRMFEEAVNDVFREFLTQMKEDGSLSDAYIKDIYFRIKRIAVELYRKNNATYKKIVEYVKDETKFEREVYFALFPKVKKQ